MPVMLNRKPDAVLEAFDALCLPSFVIDLDGKILSLNSSALDAFRSSEADLLGRNISESVSFGNAACDRSGRTSGIIPAGAHFETPCRRQNGETFTARVSVIPAEGDQRILIVQDVTYEKKLHQRASQRAKELSVFNTFAKILGRHTDTNRILQETVHMLIYLMDSESGWIYLKDDASGDLHLAAHSGFPEALLTDVVRLRPGECLSGKVLTSGRPLVVKSAAEDPRVMHENPGIESLVSVPIASRGSILGVLGLGSRRTGHFTSLDIQLLSTIANKLGVAIENMKLIRQLNEKMSQIELINELSSTINSSLSMGTIFRIMVCEIGRIIDYDRASILLYNDKDRNLLIFALDTDIETVLRKGVRAPLDTTSAGWVILNNRPWINSDLAADMPFPLDEKLRREGIRSTISIPLFQDRLLGVFNLDSTKPNNYSEKDLQILLPVAKHISIALENALLFEEISLEKQEWEKTFDAITDMVWIEDERQRVLRANKALLRRTGLSTFQVAGRPCGEILNRIGITPADCLCARTLETKKPSFQEMKEVSGNIYHYWSYPLKDLNGRLYAIVHYLKDVTAQKRLEHQLVRTEKLASLGTLVAGIAHEINNPLGIIAGYSEALLERAKDPKLLALPEFEDFPEYLWTIHHEMFRCKEILRSLLEFARPHGGTFRDLDVNELLKEVILLVNHRAARLRHHIELELNRDIPKIHADPGSLRQLFMNIIINSMYFTPEGGHIMIRTEADDRMSISGRKMVAISISDSGPGIPSGIIEKIFDPFFTTKPVGEGTGLGLSICHKIAEEHGGTIDVESKVGSGTRFIIRLPAKQVHDQSPGG